MARRRKKSRRSRKHYLRGVSASRGGNSLIQNAMNSWAEPVGIAAGLVAGAIVGKAINNAVASQSNDMIKNGAAPAALIVAGLGGAAFVKGKYHPAVTTALYAMAGWGALEGVKNFSGKDLLAGIDGLLGLGAPEQVYLPELQIAGAIGNNLPAMEIA